MKRLTTDDLNKIKQLHDSFPGKCTGCTLESLLNEIDALRIENEEMRTKLTANQSHPQTLCPCCMSDKEPEHLNPKEQGEGSGSEV